MCSIIIIPCELTSQKLLEKKVHGASNLALILLFIISNETGKRSPTEISHYSCFNPPPLISWAAQIKDGPFSCVWCGAVGRSRQHKALCLPGLCWAANPRPRDSARLFSAAGKNAPCQSPGKWNSSQHWAGGKNNHGLKINTVEIALGMQTHTCTAIFVKKGNNTHQLWMLHLSQLHVSTLLHYGCWVCWSCATLELKSLSR